MFDFARMLRPGSFGIKHLPSYTEPLKSQSDESAQTGFRSKTKSKIQSSRLQKYPVCQCFIKIACDVTHVIALRLNKII